VRQHPRLVVVQILEHLLQRLDRARLRAADVLGQLVAPAGDVQQDGLKVRARRPGLAPWASTPAPITPWVRIGV
jgi:hypothetical protein